MNLGDTMENLQEAKPIVKLIGYTKTVNGEGPEYIVASAAKLCYSKVGVDEMMEKMTEESVNKFISNLANLHHESPFEHASFTFYIEGISRACSHQIVRHRIASYSQQSQRYVDLSSTFKYIIPDEIKGNVEAEKLYVESMQKDFNYYKEISETLYESYIKGLTEPTKLELNKLRKKALENVRFALPNACETKMVVTMNARSLFNFFEHRMCNRAQEEIREVANQMLDLVLDVSPVLFQNAGAPCTFGTCKEGKMSCGKRQQPKEKQLIYKKEGDKK